jgi:hypothetical protein
MASAFWYMTTRDGELNKFSFSAQDTFMTEATAVLEEFRRLLGAYNVKFSKRSTARRKASWLLLTDAMGALRDATDALKRARFRSAAILFRAADETTVLARCFRSGSEKSADIRRRWFKGEVILPREARAAIRRRNQSSGSLDAKSHHALSQLTHRTYDAIQHGCAPAKGKLAHVEYSRAERAIPAVTKTVYNVVLAALIRSFSDALVESRLADHKSVMAAWRRVTGEDVRCPVRTRVGTRCSRMAAQPLGRCWQHRFAT